MNDAYVKQYASLERQHWWFRVRRQIILRSIKHTCPRKSIPLHILNVGAAGGASSEWLGDLGHVVSLENDPFFISFLRENKIEVVEGSADQLPFPDNSFDLVCAFDVLEHVKNDTTAMSEFLRVCKPGGTITVTVPALKMLWSYHDELNGHYRRYSKRSLQLVLDKFPGKTTMEIRFFNFLLFLPVLLARKIANLSSGQKISGQSDFTYYKTSSFFNKVLEKIFGLELKLPRFLKFPFGVSLVAVMKKDL